MLYPIIFFKKFGLPFFIFNHPFIYLFFYQLILYYGYILLKNKIYFILAVYGIIGCFFFYEKKEYYWEKTINKSNEYYLFKNMYIFPEGMITIYSHNDIEKLINLAIQTKKKIIIGISWQQLENSIIIGKTGLLVIYPCGYYYIREKNHALGFAETPAQSQNKKKYIDNILICSEFFLMPLYNKKKINIDYVIASIEWTNTRYNKIYYYIMKSIYALYEL